MNGLSVSEGPRVIKIYVVNLRETFLMQIVFLVFYNSKRDPECFGVLSVLLFFFLPQTNSLKITHSAAFFILCILWQGEFVPGSNRFGCLSLIIQGRRLCAPDGELTSESCFPQQQSVPPVALSGAVM